MTFWPRVFSAVVCWFLSMLALLTVVAHYFGPITTDDLLLKVFWVIGLGTAAIVVLVGTLSLWLWVWARKYW